MLSWKYQTTPINSPKIQNHISAIIFWNFKVISIGKGINFNILKKGLLVFFFMQLNYFINKMERELQNKEIELRSGIFDRNKNKEGE